MARPDSTSRALSVPSSRLSRFGRLSALTAGVAGNMAVHGLAQWGQGQRPGMRDLLLTPHNMRRVADQLAQMRGAAMKVGQLMSMDSGDVLPPELAEILARLRDDAHFMPPAQLKKVLNAAWPKGWLGQFAKFDVRPIAAASIGQVHRAQLKDGRDLAIKVQYPGVARSIDSDVANVGALIRLTGLLPKGFELGPYLEEGRKQLHEETDYLREAAQLTRFREVLADWPGVQLPEVAQDWSTQTVLAMSHLKGEPVEAAMVLDQCRRNDLARRLIVLTLAEMFDFGLMQTDPNFANYLYDASADRIILLDFGATRDLDPKVTAQYRALLKAGLADDAVGLRQTAVEMGFLAADTEERHADQVVRMMRIAFGALGTDGCYDFTDQTVSRLMQAEGMALAEAGFVPPPVPIDVLLIQRKLGGVFLLAARLGATLNIQEMLAQYVETAA
ncbi:MAG: AarF/ABC1/UbiB kinase family protein [Pseudomonadota bacterium]